MSYFTSAASLDDIETPPRFARDQQYQSSNANSALTMKRRQQQQQQPLRNRTQKNTNSQKVNNVLESIHGSAYDETDQLSNFTPLAPPQPATRTSTNEQMPHPANAVFHDIDSATGLAPNTARDNRNDLSENFMTEQQTQDYYRRIMPGMSAPMNNVGGGGRDDSSPYKDKLNYIIHLLEMQQDEKTDHMKEDVILYGFLGIFIIFISDSFVRVGKYVR